MDRVVDREPGSHCALGASRDASAAVCAGSGLRAEWEANSGTLRPLLPGDQLTGGCEQLWARRDAQHPWQLDFVLDRSGDDGWAFIRDTRIRVRGHALRSRSGWFMLMHFDTITVWL